MLLEGFFGKRQVFQMNPQLEYRGFKERVEFVLLEQQTVWKEPLSLFLRITTRDTLKY